MKVGVWFATNKREKCCLTKILETIAKTLATNQLCAKSFELAQILAWQRVA
jgi:hypothetical protein